MYSLGLLIVIWRPLGEDFCIFLRNKIREAVTPWRSLRRARPITKQNMLMAIRRLSLAAQLFCWHGGHEVDELHM